MSKLGKAIFLVFHSGVVGSAAWLACQLPENPFLWATVLVTGLFSWMSWETAK